MIRYPGSKDKIARAIIARFPDPLRIGGLFAHGSKLEYREPFFGAGAVGFRAIQALSPSHRVWLNDRDLGIVCLWNAVLTAPDELVEKVRGFTPTVDAFYLFREQDGQRDIDPVEHGFRKLALHQISFSGLGARAGGPLGGRQQSSAYNVDCRWSASRLSHDIWRLHRLLTSFMEVRITCRDFAEVIDGAPEHAFIYVDPPYVDKGPELYKHSMSDADHRRLATLLGACRASWVLSYDDHGLIRDLYGSWARIQNVHTTYTTAVANGPRRKNSEVLITPLVSMAEVCSPPSSRRNTKVVS